MTALLPGSSIFVLSLVIWTYIKANYALRSVLCVEDPRSRLLSIILLRPPVRIMSLYTFRCLLAFFRCLGQL